MRQISRMIFQNYFPYTEEAQEILSGVAVNDVRTVFG
jgi:hypothetical protein